MKRSTPLRPWAFAWCYDKLVAVAQDHGYALALHGSMTRDLDLIAVPWTDNASSKQVLITALDEAVDKFRLAPLRRKKFDLDRPTKKPHGRTAYALHMGGEPYIDISIMPRRSPRKKSATKKIGSTTPVKGKMK